MDHNSRSSDKPERTGVRGWVWRHVETVQYAIVVTGLSGIGLLVPSWVLTDGLLGVKIGLFLVGTAAFGYAIYLAWPTSPEDLKAAPETPPTRFQSLVRSLPPVSWAPPHPAERASHAVRVASAGSLLWLVSFLMEAVFGVVG